MPLLGGSEENPCVQLELGNACVTVVLSLSFSKAELECFLALG